MVVIPAIDIRAGRVARLVRGDRARAVVYADTPLAWAKRWVAAGARWLHVVDLDGASVGRPVHVDVLRRICALGVPVQVGGGYRTPEDIERGLAAGAARIVVGTAALDAPDGLGGFGDRVVVSVDARGGKVAVEGWTRQTATDAAAVARDLRARGVHRFIFTDIARDGTLAGPNVAALRAFIAAAGAPVIAAGGVASADDLAAVRAAGAEGAIVGRALYEGRLELAAVARRWSRRPC